MPLLGLSNSEENLPTRNAGKLDFYIFNNVKFQAPLNVSIPYNIYVEKNTKIEYMVMRMDLFVFVFLIYNSKLIKTDLRLSKLIVMKIIK